MQFNHFLNFTLRKKSVKKNTLFYLSVLSGVFTDIIFHEISFIIFHRILILEKEKMRYNLFLKIREKRRILEKILRATYVSKVYYILNFFFLRILIEENKSLCKKYIF